MQEPAKEPARLSWENELLTPPAMEAFYEANKKNREAREHDREERNWHRTLFNIGCLAFGFLGMASATATHIMTPPPQPPQFLPFDSRTGWAGEPITARDLPMLYIEATRQHAIQDYVERCESYIPQTWSTLDYTACALMSTPAEQKRRAAKYGDSSSPAYPPGVFKSGYAVVEQFPESGFVPIGESGSDPHKTYKYKIRFQRAETSGSATKHPWYTGEITFTFRPDLKMSVPDRRINPTGMQTIVFIATKD